MKLLAIECTTNHCSVALSLNEAPIKEVVNASERDHSSTLFKSIHDVMAGHHLEDLTALATTIGPGSFTGIRIGISIIQGLQISLHCPYYGIPVFHSLLSPLKTEDYEKTIIIVDSKREFYFYQIFDSQKKELTKPSTGTINQIIEANKEASSVLISGNIQPSHLDKIVFPNHFTIDHKIPMASDICHFVKENIKNIGNTYSKLDPLYIKDADVTFSKSNPLSRLFFKPSS